MAKKSIANYGVSSSVAPADVAPADADEFERELIKSLRQDRLIQLKNQIQSPGARALESPPATSLTEQTKSMIDIVKVTTDAHKDLSDTNREERIAAENRAKEIEANAASQTAQAVENAKSEATTMMGLFKDFFSETRERDTQIAGMRLENEKQIGQLKEQIAETKLAALESKVDAKFEAMEQAHKNEIQQREEKIAKLQSENEYLANRETLDSAIVHTLKTGELHPSLSALTRLMTPATVDDEDPNRLASKILAKGWAENEVEKSKAQVTKAKNDVANADEMQKTVRKAVNGVVDLLGVAQAHLPLLFGQAPIDYEDDTPPINLRPEQAEGE